eukprot:jgi/Galph1/4071/GphlegSOOS_G2764.1
MKPPSSVAFMRILLATFLFVLLTSGFVDAKKKTVKSASPSPTVEDSFVSPLKDSTPSNITFPNNVVELSTENWNETIDGSKPAVVMFYLSWCSHCRDMEPDFVKLAEAATSGVVLGRVNLEKNLELAKRFRVDGAPTLLYFSRGNASAQELLVRKPGAIASQINKLENARIFDLDDDELKIEELQYLEASEFSFKHATNFSLADVQEKITKRQTPLLVLFIAKGSEPEHEQKNHQAALDVVAGIVKEVRAGFTDTPEIQVGSVEVNDENTLKKLGKSLGFTTKEFKSKVILFPQPEKGKQVTPIDCDEGRQKGCHSADAMVALLNDKVGFDITWEQSKRTNICNEANFGNVLISSAGELDIENDAG